MTLRGRWKELAAAGLLALMAANLCVVIARKNITNDEIVHIPAGYYGLVAGAFQLNNEHPPLIKMWAALPLLFIQPNEPLTPVEETPGNFSERTWSFQERFWQANREWFAAISCWTRLMMVLLTLALGLLIFIFARKLFGATAGLLALALFTLEPTVLAHGRIVHTDLPAALAYLLFFFALHSYFQARTLRRAALLGLVTGLALLTKFSMIVLLLILALLTLAALLFPARMKGPRAQTARHATLVAVIILLLLNGVYYFRSPPVEPSDVRWVETRSGPAAGKWLGFFEGGARILPTYYLFGQYNVWLHNRDGHAASLLGQHRMKGWWYYFPVAFALKTSLPFLLLALAAIAWIIWHSLGRRDPRFFWLLIPPAIYAALCMSSHINIGIRHFLPVYPFLFMGAGALLARMLRLRAGWPAPIVVVACLCGWMGVEAARAFPDYIPYLNQFAAHRPPWSYLSDSNIEWGDDVRGLAEFLHERGEKEVLAMVMGGWGTLYQHGITGHSPYPQAGAVAPATRYIAIGASFLNGSTVSLPAKKNGKPFSAEENIHYFAAYRERKPEAIFGRSIYLYRE